MSEKNFSALRLDEFFARTAGPEPNPGGGGVMGVVGALGLGLNAMGLCISGEKTAQQKEAMQTLVSLAELDGDSFQAVLDAWKLPKGSAERKQAVEAGFQEALRIPETMITLLLEALQEQAELAQKVKRWPLADVAAGTKLLVAAVEGLVYNCWMNGKELRDPSHRETHRTFARRALQQAYAAEAAVHEVLVARWSGFDEWLGRDSKDGLDFDGN